ncbi:66_t:CDS:2 [Diversispora eburnea]|uniref:66_t:CDS:1 n=1 Tax=Diversispora eburnea TaxID=1213867 RepID=A0A9N9G745_9GLOM|nr:66_t:CDS:2 [Diversispora eburnea]
MYGVILYMAPELFSLGMIMWELTTGREISQLFLDFEYNYCHLKDDIKEHYPDKYVIDILLELLAFKKAKKERLEMIKSKKRLLIIHYTSFQISISLDSMLESITNSSSISVKFPHKDFSTIRDRRFDLSLSNKFSLVSINALTGTFPSTRLYK